MNAKGVLGVMGLGAKKGAEITVTVDGEDEEIAASELETVFKREPVRSISFWKSQRNGLLRES